MRTTSTRRRFLAASIALTLLGSFIGARRLAAARAARQHQTSALEASEIPANALRYTVVFFSKPIGVEGVWSTGPREWRYHYEYNDRGHGPWVDGSVVLDDQGAPQSSTLHGHDESEAEVDDRLQTVGHTRSWKNDIEKGQADQAGFYLSAPVVHEQIAGVPEELAMLCRALLKAPDHKMHVLPAGEARVTRVAELQVRSAGQQKTVVEYRLEGLDFEPVSLWLEPDGTTFAILGDLTLVRKGWESALPALTAAQERARRDRDAQLVKQLAWQPSRPVAFRHVDLFDSEAATTQRDMVVLVHGPRIEAVGREGEQPIPADVETIDARGKSLVPGLWDMHVHLEGIEGLLSLAVGVTTVRDLGNDVDDAVAMRTAFETGARIGPRMLLAGLIDGRGPYQSSLGIAVATEKDVEDAINRYAGLGFDQIKVYSSVPPKLVPTIVSLAHARGMRVSGHVPMHMLAQDVIAGGFDEVQHIYYLLLNFMPDVMNRDAPVGLVAAIGERAAAIDLDSPQVHSLVQLLKDRGTVVDPTLNAFESLLTARPGVPEPSLALVVDRLPLKMQRSALKGGITVPNGQDQRYRDAFQACLRMTSALYAARIPLVIGTDFLAGFTYQRELELHVAAGIPPAAVLQSATFGAAKIMKRDAELGSIRPGKLADMVLVDGDPAKDIRDIRRVVTVVKNGTIYSAAALQASIGVRPSTAPAGK